MAMADDYQPLRWCRALGKGAERSVGQYRPKCAESPHLQQVSP
ncbi:uncharacterized protein METZ01_LOCUS59770 [marine metagenome]|uniref:Uncharacterized protein n=1 Tax=marine metagenome TaxID=408172 RepID=A0A381SSD8_9ZZZZ